MHKIQRWLEFHERTNAIEATVLVGMLFATCVMGVLFAIACSNL